MLTKTDLKNRGWSDRLIRLLLGEPDSTAINRHYRSGPPVQLFDEQRVEEAERQQEFIDHRAKCKMRTGEKATAARIAKFRKKYPDRPSMLKDACEALFNLNRYAKHDRCTRPHRDRIYCLKSAFIKNLYEAGLIDRVAIHSAIASPLQCNRCQGTGDFGRYWRYDTGRECHKCHGTGIWRSKTELRFVVFSLEVDGQRYSWHQPEEYVDWKFEETPPTEDTTWTTGEVKPVALQRAKFAEAKHLIEYYLTDTGK